MSSFRFNFSGSGEEEQHPGESKEEIQWLESEEVLPDKQINNIDEIVVHARMFTCGDVEIGHVVPKDALLSAGENKLNNVELAEKQHSDLVAGKYEGGLKIWECTTDLIEFLINEEIKLEDTRVLDLGCGAGILGIYAFMNGSTVTFQDYNKEVVECVTIPNVLLNIEDDERASSIKKCRFYSGDWASFSKLVSSETYDVILTSETIYNQFNYDKLLNLFLQCLSNNGAAYVAAKTYYFGVGGGTRQFELTIEKNGLFKSEVCWKSSGGIQREILKVTKK